MQKIYFFVQLTLCFCTFFISISNAQPCSSLSATATSYESRCAATGSIKIMATGGSGSYKYKVTGFVNSNYTTSDSITGLGAGTYTVIVNDIVNNCTFNVPNVVVNGTYQDPRFTLAGVHVSCDNGNNANITVTGQQYGRPPFAYSIVAPSPMGIGTINSTGIFPDLIAGDYSIRLTDSCGGIQTRSITINNYTWWIDSYGFTKISCDSASGFIKVVDSRGNVSTVNGIPGFTYGVVRQPGDTIWSTNPNFKFYLAGTSSVEIIAKDACGKIKKGSSVVKFNPSVATNANVSNKTCNTFTLKLTSITNFFGADYCLYDSNDVLISCNTTSIFNNLPYGRYCIKAHNLCPDTTITRCVNVLPPTVSVANSVVITNKNCTSFNVAITGQVGLTNPDYCLFDSANVLMVCNTTGIFTNLLYGSYCINIIDTCRDTTITRCFTIKKPTPIVPAVIAPAYTTCTNFGVIIDGDSLYNPQFCLYDSLGVLIICNSTGIFDSLYFGNYCVNIYDSCYDTTITRCFNVGYPIAINDLTVTITNKTCSTFTINSTTSTVANPQYCLYSQSDTLIACNTTGIFNNMLYGSYCIKVHNTCPDTLFINCFSASPPIPSVNSTVGLSNKTCATFTATITNQTNLTNPQYCLFDTLNVQISCNTTGIFDSLLYGSYCIKIINTCYDTTITRCFTADSIPVDIGVTTSKSCSYGYATLAIAVNGGSLPVNIQVYRPDSTLLYNNTYNTNNFNIDSIPGIATGLTYQIIATDNCGNSDTVYTGVTASIATHTAVVHGQCPSAAWQNGSGRIESTTTTNMGIFTVRIIKKNGTLLTPELTPNTAAGGVFTFNDLGPGTYIISYKLNDLCNKYFYDTVTVAPYIYPNLNRSSAYQCDVSGFSVGAVASNGVGPFSYEIIASNPSAPSINTPPQTNPIFNINNGTNYSLIRLRALDACGNATLADASILPLANDKIEVDSNCFQSSSTLTVDPIYNSTYAWYKKDNYNSPDSTFLGAGNSVYIPYLSAGDTGTYYCYVVVNTGCVTRSYIYNLNGLCYGGVLKSGIKEFSGKYINSTVLLSWKGYDESELSNYIVERKGADNKFTEIGRLKPYINSSGLNQYSFTDNNSGSGKNFYRLKLLNNKNAYGYSNIIVVNKANVVNDIKVYPNPASDLFTIEITGAIGHQFQVKLLNMASQVVLKKTFKNDDNGKLQISRLSSMSKGVYILKCTDLNTNEIFTQKIIFQ